MSEHPELREALCEAISEALDLDDFDDFHRSMPAADALLAGPVGKLQAENEALLKHLLIADALVLKLTLGLADKVGELADPERIRREAIGAWVQAHQAGEMHQLEYANDYRKTALAAGESAVTGGPEASIDQQPFPIRCPGGYVGFDDPRVGPDRAACPSCGRVIGFHRITGRFHNHNRAVTGEATR